MRKILIAVAVTLAGFNMSAGAVELGGVKAADVAGQAENALLEVPAAAQAETANAAQSSYFFYARNQAEGDARMERYVGALKAAGISVIKAEVVDAGGVTQCNLMYKGPERIFKMEKTFPGALSMPLAKAEFERRKGELARTGAVIIEAGTVLDSDGYGKVAIYTIVYISGLPGRREAATRAVPLKEIRDVLASGHLPGGCVLETNYLTSSAFEPVTGDSLNVGVIKAGEFTDMLIVGLADAQSSQAGTMYSYERVSCPAGGWFGRCEKNSFTLKMDGSGQVVHLSMEKAKERGGLVGSGWKVTDSLVCR